MSDFAQRIRDARSAPRPVLGPAPHPHLAPAPPVYDRAAGPSVEELEAQRERLDALARKIDDLNAAILHEILREPGGAVQYPRTVAALADELAAEAG
jgi:hypothetical protein